MTIRDIAARCGVSVATVSRVINNNPNVSPKTREEVLAVIQAQGYTPNAFARGLGLNTMRMVGILCTDVANSFYSKAVSLLERSLRVKGFDTLLCCSGAQLADKKKCLELLLQKKVDAVVLVGAAFREKVDNGHIAAAAAQVPVFLINAWLDLPNVYCVYCDEKEAMRANVHHMIAAGVRRILYLHDMVDWAWAGTQKLEGFRLGLQDCGLAENPDLVRTTETGVTPAQALVDALLIQGGGFDGIIASEDLLAVGAQKALLAHGKVMPLIGFNDSLLAECTTPTITSVNNMLSIICPTAVTLLDRLLGGEQAPARIAVSASLVQRESFQLGL
ncbi:MAG: LacI family transcriptional regulator [Oscillospiraceae bacterium]|nr:LacI family transcriptional regulator [Oscillospiraceae bacterium]